MAFWILGTTPVSSVKNFSFTASQPPSSAMVNSLLGTGNGFAGSLAYVFLASPESSYVIGETLHVNGGMPTP